ncbi:acyltransferase family-domain-containing protein [Aspergillus cavernicola]|uniref:Acyltransferase family-domain-containing protein n=1 Tax=Aspergillus cavernicola TaxID=176166 RepID=A0ABR4II45_9EURO
MNIDHGPQSSPAIHNVPLNDVESGLDREFQGRGLSWTSLRSLPTSDFLSDPSKISPLLEDFSDHWQDYLEDWFTKLGIVITPSYLQHLVGGRPPPQTKLHAIAALDGLRGWACLLVFNFHFLFTYTWKVAVGWGFNNDNFHFYQLPIIHVLVSGHIMVAIFFVISGYVLSYKPLKLIRNRSWEETFVVLASSTFRRGLRLYIPSIVGIMLVLVAVRLGAYNYSQKVLFEGHTITGTNEQHPPIMVKSFLKQWCDWYAAVARLMDPFDWALYYNNYNPHLWTIPVEFRSSMVLFLTILATSRVKMMVRVSLVSTLVWFCMRYGRWDVVLFLSGMLMAEADLIQGLWENRPSAEVQEDKEKRAWSSHNNLSLSKYQPSFRLLSRKRWIVLLILGLYLGSTPNTGYKFTPFFMWTWHITPKTYPEPHRFPQTLGAVMIVYSINHSKDIQKLFINPVSQYLGKISYAFYIVHGPILHSLGYSLMPNIWSITGKETNFKYCLGFFITWLICLPVSLWAGDLFWRLVDIPSVSLAKWIENTVLAKTTRREKAAPTQRVASHVN